MSIGKHYTVTGLLLHSIHGPVLEADGGGSWVLDVDARADLFGRRVTVEGSRSGFNRLDVHRMTPAKAR